MTDFKKQLLKTIEKHACDNGYSHAASIKDRIQNEILKQAKAGKTIFEFDLPPAEGDLREVAVVAQVFLEREGLVYALSKTDDGMIHVYASPFIHQKLDI